MVPGGIKARSAMYFDTINSQAQAHTVCLSLCPPTACRWEMLSHPAVGAGLTGPNQSHAATQWPYSDAFYLMYQYTKVTMGYSVLVVVFFIFNAKPRKVSTLESFRAKENTSREISRFLFISIVCLYSVFSVLIYLFLHSCNQPFY